MWNVASLTWNLNQNLLFSCAFAWLIVEFAGHLKTVLWLFVSYWIEFCIAYYLLSFLVQAVTQYPFLFLFKVSDFIQESKIQGKRGIFVDKQTLN